MATPTPTDRFVDRCAGASIDALSDEALEKLKRHLLDHLGVAVGGRAVAASGPAFEAGVEALDGDSPGEATAVASGRRYAADHAALLNGAFAHSLDFDDTHRASSLHPGAPVIPAALAVAERDGVSAERFLAGVAAGFDVACTLGQAVNPSVHYERGFHITATCGTFGATAAAGAIAGLSREALADAFGLNGSQAAGSLQFLANGAWNKRLHPGLAAQRAVTAVSLAEAGVRGAADPVAGTYGFFASYTADPDDAAFDGFGERNAVLETGLKPYPCCRYMHPAIDGLLELAPAIDPDDVETIRVELPRSGRQLTGDPLDAKRRPANFVDCQFSMPFAAALALSAGDAGLAAFLDAQPRLDDPALRRLMGATDVLTTDAVEAPFPERWAARVVVDAGGESHERFVDVARGEPENPLSWDAVIEKFEALTGAAGWSADDAASVTDAVRSIERREVDDLVDALRTAAAAAADA